jgi:hypothetical protein
MTPAGFPHSDISGSKPACGSPKLFAANHVLHRLLTPRHSPCALSSLVTNFARNPKRVPHPPRSLWSAKPSVARFAVVCSVSGANSACGVPQRTNPPRRKIVAHLLSLSRYAVYKVENESPLRLTSFSPLTLDCFLIQARWLEFR